MKLKNKVAIITGGSRGIGKKIVETFLREGAQVIILARKKEEIQNAVREFLPIARGALMGSAVDVGDYKAVRAVVSKIEKKFGRVDVLVNCAGIQDPIGPLAMNIMEEWEKNIKINLLGTAYMSRAVLPNMIKRKSGVIVNFSGGGATSSRPNFSAYATAKAGVVRFTEVLADELKGSRVRVNAIAPGAVNTKMLEEVLEAGKRAGKAELAAAKKREKEGGASAREAAALVVFLASIDSGNLSGRLVSAVWDDWKHWSKKDIKKIMSGDSLTLRRVK